MREYLVTPALIVYRSDTQGMSEKARGKLPERPSLADVRYDRVLDSGVAGVLAGGTLSGFLRDYPHSLLSRDPGAFQTADEQAGRARYPERG